MALPNMEFWAWLKHIGAIQGDANYYSSGQAGAEEYENALRVAYKYLQGASDPRVMGQFWEYLESMGAIQGDPTYYSSGQAGAEEFENAFKVSTDFFASGGGTDAYVPTKPGAPPEENKAEKGVGGAGPDPETRLTILTSNDMKWYFDKGSGRWYVSYGLPNGTKQLLFEADPDQMDALFGEGMRPSSYETVTTKALLARDSIVFAGNVAEMEGTGSFEAEFEKVIAIAKNNGQLPSWMQGDPKALDLIFIAQTENKSNDWLVNEFSKLDSFKARFPGIQKLQTSG